MQDKKKKDKKEGYSPEYARGQIFVLFKRDYDLEFVKEFGETLGYCLSNEDYLWSSFYIFQTKVGEEQAARQRFESYSEFVESTDLRDLKLESRWGGIEKIIEKIEDLSDEMDLPDKVYNSRIDEIINNLRKIKVK